MPTVKRAAGHRLAGQNVIAWLRTDEGVFWSRHRVGDTGLLGNSSRHSGGVFADVKEDTPRICSGVDDFIHKQCVDGANFAKLSEKAIEQHWCSVTCVCLECLDADQMLLT